MGAWGTAISDNDTFLDVHAGFFGLYDKGMDLGEITDRLKGEYRDLIKNEEEPDAHAFWFAIAQAQWECKGLQAEVLEQVKRIIETGKDLEAWHVSDRARRKESLGRFLAMISVERAKAKPRKKVKPPFFQKGDCISIRLDSGRYGGVVILEALEGDGETPSLNLAAATRLDQSTKPVPKDFEKAEVLITNHQFDNDKQAQQCIEWLFQSGQKKVKGMVEWVGRLNVVYTYSPSKNYGSPKPMGAWFEQVREELPLQLASESTKPRYPHVKYIRDLISKDTWTYW